jgi:alkanesulfonate monooxygenase SsuD/methylene tetrahydromethanopterin reductase-like flavin-dependent oxidoreductase (luciferase family)
VTLQFGVCVPPFANPGPAFFRTPGWTTLDPARAIDAAVEAERLGYDSVWMADHLMHGFDDAILEGWTTLSFIAGRTSRVKLGSIHLAQPFREPAIAAKMAATLDALSNGRLIFFYDCGWQEQEVRAYGLPWPSEEERISRMEEGLDLIKALWASDSPVTFDGHYYRTDAAVCRPGPMQKPRPPIWLGEARDARWLDAIVRHADGWNSVPASPDRLREKLDAVRGACQRLGRDMAELEISLEIEILVAPTHDQARNTLREIAALPPSRRGSPRADVLAALESDGPMRVNGWLVGTPEDVIAQVGEYQALGVTHFMLWFLDFPKLDGLRLFAEQVAPKLRGQS